MGFVGYCEGVVWTGEVCRDFGKEISTAGTRCKLHGLGLIVRERWELGFEFVDEFFLMGR